MIRLRTRGRDDEITVSRAELDALSARVAALEAAGSHRRRRQRPCPAGHDAQLLIAVAAAVADRAFSAAEVIAHVHVDPALAEALAAARISNARRLGKLFGRLEDHDVAGLRLERLGVERDGIVWRVSRT